MTGFLQSSAGGRAVAAPPSRPQVFGWIVAGFVLGGGILGGFGTWAALAPLASASMAPGVVKVDSHRKTIQHYEGGIIREILVRDGDLVREGQILLRLDDLDARAESAAMQGQLDALRAREARLVAQRDGLNAIQFPEELLSRGADSEISMMIEGQIRIFEDQSRAVDAEVAVLRQRAGQLKAQIAAHQAENASLELQLATLELEHVTAAQLHTSGFERRTRVLELERHIAAARGQVAANEQRIVALGEQVIETDLQETSLRVARAGAVSEELREIQTRASEIAQRMQRWQAQIGRKDIVAPQDGIVVNLRYFTFGGVIAPGAEVLDIVPVEDKLIVEARVRPLDIDIVRVGLPASIRLLAFKQRTTPTLDGVVLRISADALTDPRTGEVYFLATIEVPPEELVRVPDVELYPGMPVEVAIVTGERTLLAYLAQPLTDSFAHAFRED